MQYQLEKPVSGTIGTRKYQCTIEWRNGKLLTDEPEPIGGEDSGPDPITLLLSSLASCTLITLRMYIDRKGWDIPRMAVNTNLFQTVREEKEMTILDLDLNFLSPIDEDQRKRLLDIAGRCPVSRILEGDVQIRTFLYRDEETAKKIPYRNDEVTIVWKPEFCMHSGRCVTELPQVFNLKEKPWINVNGADTQAIIAQVKKCPTGALRYVDHRAQNSPESAKEDDR